MIYRLDKAMKQLVFQIHQPLLNPAAPQSQPIHRILKPFLPQHVLYNKEAFFMPTCKTCGTEWTWKESIKASWKFSGTMSCPYCNSDQYATPKSRKRMTLINWLVLLPMPFAAIFDLPLIYSISMILILFAAALSLIPKMMELSNDQKPLW